MEKLFNIDNNYISQKKNNNIVIYLDYENIRFINFFLKLLKKNKIIFLYNNFTIEDKVKYNKKNILFFKNIKNNRIFKCYK